jgi:outer membrane protein assembly factor BamB
MSGQIYASTGNGDYNPSVGDYGDSALALRNDASALVAHFTPPNFVMLASDDIDLGSTAPALIPRLTGTNTPLLAVQGGKDGILRLLNRANLNAAPLQSVTLPVQGEIVSAPAVYRTASGQTFVYVGMPSAVLAYQVTIQKNGVPELGLSWTATVAQGRGTSPIVRAGVVYVSATNQLVALDATTGAILGSNNALGAVHWQSPVVARAVVYCSDTNGNLTAFSVSP